MRKIIVVGLIAAALFSAMFLRYGERSVKVVTPVHATVKCAAGTRCSTWVGIDAAAK